MVFYTGISFSYICHLYGSCTEPPLNITAITVASSDADDKIFSFSEVEMYRDNACRGEVPMGITDE
jgi:hypothetical protein